MDGKEAFVGSQNFDWRALEQIQETGLRISDPQTVQQIQAIFDQDWQAQALLAEGKTVPKPPRQAVASAPQGNYLVASPRDYNPSGVIDFAGGAAEAAGERQIADPGAGDGLCAAGVGRKGKPALLCAH
ncbi:protein K4 [Klebsiella michiganensis]|nr:protein K4 [Klebsiella michiganensis]